MNILHISQGVPPFRVGGLTRYCCDLMEQQIKAGHKVSLLYPGSFTIGKTRIKKEFHPDLKLYSIINPLPLALVFGINEPSRYMQPSGSHCFEKFLRQGEYDMIHIHCIMGVHLEFFEVAKYLHIPMVMTTHDYYPFCIRCTFLDSKEELCSSPSGEQCRLCNVGKGLSRKKETLMQSKIYSKLKYSNVVARIRNYSRKQLECTKIYSSPTSTNEEYDKLLKYNKSILNHIDLFHCNSELSKQIYQKYLPKAQYKVITITHANMAPSPILHTKKEATGLNIGFMGGKGEAKGLSKLLEGLQLINYEHKKNWQLYLYGADYNTFVSDERIHNCGKYAVNELGKIFANLDVVVMPSIWWETFGFVEAEALSYGVPVVVSNMVGAGILVEKFDRFLIYKANDEKELGEKLLNFFELDFYNMIAQWVYKSHLVKTIEEHEKEINLMYKDLTEY
ncbi:glycosyltransferase [Clostridium sp. CF011]|uniref:glycosyltransferase n=1 Tax=Clostridium sp. CF011 TaxID=2843318 RepID=UPI001C0BA1FE|nr:glycosyltransferase [Clostridium sp. CF011]MBU3093651.1 glycosyltransferase [Clostridium sp. CF011]WAG69343.1 glycosyltransferase [Clostridium sp. CF011]